MEDDEIDNLLNDDEDIAPVEELTEMDIKFSENLGGDIESIKADPEVLDRLPELRGDQIPQEFVSLKDMIIGRYKTLPEIDFESFNSELSQLMVKSKPTPTLQHINMELQKIQAAKERMTEIISVIIPCHVFKKRAVDLLKDAWMKFSTGKTAALKQGDSAYVLSDFDADYGAVDAMYKTAMHIAKNLDSTQEILSRRITCISLQVKIYDNGRHTMPEGLYGPTDSLEEVIEEEFDPNAEPSVEMSEF